MYIDDRVLKKINNECSYYYTVYEHARTVVVVGRSCKPEEDVHVDRCRTDHVPILRRIGGGGTVVLTKGIIVVSVSGKTSLHFHLQEHMNAVNRAIVNAIAYFRVKNLSTKGISDITMSNKKILGSSLHRKKDIVLYQGSLLLNPDLTLFERYMKHPQKEPDYRNGRTHSDFITSLWEEGYKIDKMELISALEDELSLGPPWASLKPVN